MPTSQDCGITEFPLQIYTRRLCLFSRSTNRTFAQESLPLQGMSPSVEQELTLHQVDGGR